MIYAYLRVSTHKQDVDAQKMTVLDYAQKHKLMIDHFYKVEMSATKSKSKRQIDRMVNDLKSGDTLIVAEISRLGRNMIDILNLVKELSELGVVLVFVRQPELSTDGSMRDLLIAIYGYFAQVERELMSERTKAGLEKARASGKKIGRAKGSIGKSKLDPHKDHIAVLLGRDLSITSIARLFEVAPGTLRYYIKTRKIKPRIGEITLS